MTSVQGTSTAGVMGTEAAVAVDTSQLSSHLATALDRAAQMIGDRIADLLQQIAGSSSGAEGAELQQEVDRLQGALDRFSDQVHELNNRNGMQMGALHSAVSELRGEIAESYSNFGTAEVDAGTFAEAGAVEQEPVRLGLFGRIADRIVGRVMDQVQAMADKFRTALQAPPATEGTAAATSAETTTSEATTQASEAAAAPTEVDAEDPAQMLALYNQDPQAFYEQLKELPAEERAMMMHMVQTEMQQINQMFTMMSQLSQAMHDTQKAIINNLRV